jgi:hypothetical protein
MFEACEICGCELDYFDGSRWVGKCKSCSNEERRSAYRSEEKERYMKVMCEDFPNDFYEDYEDF